MTDNRFSASLSVFYMAHRGTAPRTVGQPSVESIRQMVEAGFGAELWLSEPNYVPFPEGAEQAIRELVCSVSPVTVHTSTHKWMPDELRKEIIFSQRMSASCLVVHPSTFGLESCETLSSAEELRDICAFARGHGVTLAFENSGVTGIEMLRRAVDLVGADPDSTGMGICIDTGHALRAYSRDGAEALTYFEEFRDLIVEIHINDNEGVEDLHLAPGEGKLDWAEILPIIHSLPRNPILCLEITTPGEPVQSLKAARAYISQSC